MAAIPEGYVHLGLVGFTDRGGYQGNETYMENDLVHRNNAIWKCKADNTIGILPAENENWEVFINSTTSLEGISAVDTKGIMGTGGEIVASQALIDALATKVMESIPMNKIVNHFMATDPTTVLSGPMGKTLNDRCDQLNSDLSTFVRVGAIEKIDFGYDSSNIGYEFVYIGFKVANWATFQLRIFVQPNPSVKASLFKIENSVYTKMWDL